MNGYRIWPAMLLAALSAAGAMTLVVAEATLRDDGCAEGLEWAAVAAIPESAGGEQPVLADYRRQFRPIFSGCLDVDDLPRLDPAEIPDPRS
ncbi:MAG: hypothetical protein ACR2JK_12895 [Geodermatophilaceae bacterium]